MQEKRKEKRIDVSLYLQISSLFKQDNVLVQNLNAPIVVTNISKGGIGFCSQSSLPEGYYFNACLQLGDEDAKLYCVIKILRVEELTETTKLLEDCGITGKSYRYGCEFVGMAPVLSYIFDQYEKSIG